MGIVYDPWGPGTHHCDPPRSEWVKIFQRYRTEHYDVGTVWECDHCGSFYQTRVYGHGSIVWEPIDSHSWQVREVKRRREQAAQETHAVTEIKELEGATTGRKPWYERWFG